MDIKRIRKFGKEAKGRKGLIEHLSGQQLTMRDAIFAKCYECTNMYADGKVDCEIKGCPLYPFMPYRKGEKVVLRKLSDKQKEKITLNLNRKKRSNIPIMQYYVQ